MPWDTIEAGEDCSPSSRSLRCHSERASPSIISRTKYATYAQSALIRYCPRMRRYESPPLRRGISLILNEVLSYITIPKNPTPPPSNPETPRFVLPSPPLRLSASEPVIPRFSSTPIPTHRLLPLTPNLPRTAYPFPSSPTHPN